MPAHPVGVERSARAIEVTSWLALALVASCAVALRFYRIDHLPGINGDEPQYGVHALAWLDGAPLGSLRTGSDLPMNPLFFGTVVLLHGLLPASLWTLRLAAVVQSLLAIGLSFALFRRRGRTFAATMACLVAVLPVHLGYARFAWDPTAIPTAVVLALAFATGQRLALALVAFVLGVWVHPTTIFVLPVLVVPVVAARWPRDAAGRISRPPARAIGMALFATAAGAALVVLLLKLDVLPAALSDAVRGALSRAVFERELRPTALLHFLRACLDLFSGATIYHYVPASLSDSSARLHLIAALVVILPLGAAGLRRQYLERRTIDLGVAAGVCVALAIAYLVSGPDMFEPSIERYGMWVTVPGCYVVASWVDALASTRLRAGALRAGTALVGAALVASFAVNYLAALRHPAPDREDTFRTGPIDPKRLALEELVRMRDPNRTTLVSAEDWWIYWTLRYLAPPETGVRVTIYGMTPSRAFPDDFRLPRYDPSTMERFAVVWAGDRLDRDIARRSPERVDVYGYEPGPILRVHRLPASD